MRGPAENQSQRPYAFLEDTSEQYLQSDGSQNSPALFYASAFPMMGQSKLLIERSDWRHWRIVARECTRTGLSSDRFTVLSENHRDFLVARWLFQEIKYGKYSAAYILGQKEREPQP